MSRVKFRIFEPPFSYKNRPICYKSFLWSRETLKFPLIIKHYHYEIQGSKRKLERQADRRPGLLCRHDRRQPLVYGAVSQKGRPDVVLVKGYARTQDGRLLVIINPGTQPSKFRKNQ